MVRIASLYGVCCRFESCLAHKITGSRVPVFYILLLYNAPVKAGAKGLKTMIEEIEIYNSDVSAYYIRGDVPEFGVSVEIKKDERKHLVLTKAQLLKLQDCIDTLVRAIDE